MTRVLLALFLVNIVFIQKVCAYTANATVKSGEVIWKNAYPIEGSDTFTLSSWDSISNLLPTTEWSPASFATTMPTTMTLRGPNSTTVEVELKLIGMQYNIGGNPIPEESPGNPIGVGNVCQNSNTSGNIYSVSDESNSTCYVDKTLRYSASYNPFYFARPIFKVSEEELTAAFDGKEIGTYSGAVTAPFGYYYQTSSGAKTYRIINKSFSFQVNYIPSYLDSIIVTGDGVIEPEYNTSNMTASGKTSYDIEALGYFVDGLELALPQEKFTLTESKYGTEIPITLNCDICNDPELVEAGVKKVDSTIITPVDSPESIKFKLDVSYSNISAEDIETGKYSGTVILLFREVI